MNILIELFQRLKRKLTFSQRNSTQSKSNLTRTQSVNIDRPRSSTGDTNSIIVRSRAGTEIFIERKLCKKSPYISQISIAESSKSDKVNKKKSHKDTSATDQRRTRAYSAPTQPFVISRHSEPVHLSLISTGSILAPRYRSRTATLGKHAIVRVTIQ